VDGVVRMGTPLVNWYLVEEAGVVTVVDTGMPKHRTQVEEGLRLLGRQPADLGAVVLTHAHADHVGGAEQIRADFGVPVFVHANDESLARTLKQPGMREASFLPYLRYPHAWKLLAHLGTSGRPRKVGEVRTFADGETLDVAGHPRVVHTPGHTTGHCALHFADGGVSRAGSPMLCVNPLTGTRGPQLMPRAFNVSTGTILDSLGRIEPIDAELLLVGHGEPWREGVAAAVERARAVGPT